MYLLNVYLSEIDLLFGGVIYSTCFLNKYAVLIYSRFILLLRLFYTDHLVSIILFNYDCLNSTTILLCLCFYSLHYTFENLNFICNHNNLHIRLPFDFTYDRDEEIRDFEIHLSIISRMWYWCCFTLTPSNGFLIYICVYLYISGHKWSTTHRVHELPQSKAIVVITGGHIVFMITYIYIYGIHHWRIL